MNHHAWADSMNDWAEANAAELKAHGANRAQPLAEPHYTAPQGRTDQGWPIRRYSPEMACWDSTQDDQTESADEQVLYWLLKGLIVVTAVLLCVWVIAGGLNA